MKKILIAEDNDINFILFREILKNMNVELVQVANGLEAVQYCDEHSDISLILMDINMPVMNGEDAAVIIKKAHPEIPIISQTAYGVYGVVADENKHCFECFITKPINVENLKGIIREYCFK